MSGSMESENIFSILMSLIIIGVFWNIYIEYRKIWNEIKALRRDVEELKKKESGE